MKLFFIGVFLLAGSPGGVLTDVTSNAAVKKDCTSCSARHLSYVPGD